MARSRWRRRLAVALALLVAAYVLAYLALAFTTARTVVVTTKEGQQIRLFLFFAPIEVRFETEYGDEVMGALHPAERPCFWVFYPLVRFEEALGTRVYSGFVSHRDVRVPNGAPNEATADD